MTIDVVSTPTPAFHLYWKWPYPDFHDQSLGAASWYWLFGDGNTSMLQNPVHTYNNYGNYVVNLIITMLVEAIRLQTAYQCIQ